MPWYTPVGFLVKTFYGHYPEVVSKTFAGDRLVGGVCISERKISYHGQQ